MIEFEDPINLKGQVKEILDKMNIHYSEDNPDPENIHFYFRQLVEEVGSTIGVHIFLTKESNYRLDIVSSVSFSPIHVEALKKARPQEIQNMIHEIKLFYLPREGELDLDLAEDDNYEGAMFAVNNPVYVNEVTIGNLDRAMLKSEKMAQLIRMLIQKHLNKLIT